MVSSQVCFLFFWIFLYIAQMSVQCFLFHRCCSKDHTAEHDGEEGDMSDESKEPRGYWSWFNKFSFLSFKIVIGEVVCNILYCVFMCEIPTCKLSLVGLKLNQVVQNILISRWSLSHPSMLDLILS